MSASGSKRGGISLEAALIMPMILLFVAAMVIGIQCVEADVKIKGALDRTATELALLSPAGRLLEDLDRQPNSENTAADAQSGSPLDDLLENIPWQGILADLALDVTSTAVAGPAIHNRLNHWIAKAMNDRPDLTSRLGDRRLFLDWKQEKNQLWLCLSYRLRTPLGSFEKLAYAVVPLWLGREEASAVQSEDSVWLLDNFSRGKIIRERFGANLPDDFPVIAALFDGEAVMIKSMDLTAPTYLERHAAELRMEQHLLVLAGFSGASYHKGDRHIQVDAPMITSRRLMLIIPENSTRDYLPAFLDDLAETAAARSINLQIVRYGISSRYQASETSADG